MLVSVCDWPQSTVCFSDGTFSRNFRPCPHAFWWIPVCVYPATVKPSWVFFHQDSKCDGWCNQKSYVPWPLSSAWMVSLTNLLPSTVHICLTWGCISYCIQVMGGWLQSNEPTAFLLTLWSQEHSFEVPPPNIQLFLTNCLFLINIHKQDSL